MPHEGQGNQNGGNAGRNRDAPGDDDPQGHPGYRLKSRVKETSGIAPPRSVHFYLVEVTSPITNALILEVVFLNHSPLGV
jgi:hypothetical protein